MLIIEKENWSKIFYGIYEKYLKLISLRRRIMYKGIEVLEKLLTDCPTKVF